MKVGYALSSEEFLPQQFIEQARAAERAGFQNLWISDHYHPWNDAEGQSPFVWTMIGALAEAVPTMRVTTAVTCPTIRMHPAVIAQATATAVVVLNGRFAFGVGAGEALNEHILGGPWPSAPVRLEMLEDAIDLIRRLWNGKMVRHRGGTTRWIVPAFTPGRRRHPRSWYPGSGRSRSSWLPASVTATSCWRRSVTRWRRSARRAVARSRSTWA